MIDYQANYERWLHEPSLDEETRRDVAAVTDDDERRMRFGSYMAFGTGGLRSVMGAGSARMNRYTVAHATEGLARLILKTPGGAARGCAVCYDSRNHSAEFARRTAEVLSAHGIRVILFSALRPTPVLSFAVRHYGCVAGVNITASHNPAEYNGYKVYWEDGGQLPPAEADIVSAEIAAVDIFRDVPAPEAADESRIEKTDASLDRAYTAAVLAEAVNPDAIAAAADTMAVVYTPLHGTGGTLIPDLLRAAGLKKLYPVAEQMAPDGDFPTVHFPNPEFPDAFVLGRALAEEVGSDLIVATDPDADRVGVMARDKTGAFRCITGNQMGALLLEYIATAYEATGKMPEEPYAVKTIVTSELSARVCAAHGVKLYNVLTDFNFIGEVIKKYEEAGHGTFFLGFEESYGYLKGTYARDKDAVVAALLICEMAACYRMRGMTLCDALDELFEKYGHFSESVFSIAMTGVDGSARMAALMDSLRKNPPAALAGKPLREIRDYLTDKATDLRTGETRSTGLPISNVLYYLTEDENLLVIRPSGTEPKIKVYVLAQGATAEAAQDNARLLADAAHTLLGA